MTVTRKKLGMLWLALIPVAMFGFGFALVPLYDVFCETLGIRMEGGDGRINNVQAQDKSDRGALQERWITVHFDTTVSGDLPWQFIPAERFIKVRVGELTEAMFYAANQATDPITGHAVPSIAPAEASIYMAKTECFCFNRQLLAAGESKDMPVRFIIDPELPERIKVLTLSYTFYRSETTAALRAQPVDLQDSPLSAAPAASLL